MKRILIITFTLFFCSCAYNKEELPEPQPNNNNNNTAIHNKVTVIASGMTFAPANVVINAGDTVEWQNTSGFHNVNGTQATYASNPESFGNAVGSGWTYTFVFNTVGNYDYQCDVHVGSGMVGTVTVQ